MRIIIGGVERKINQVDTYVEYMGGNVGNKTAEEIFTESRAGKLFDKVLQLRMDDTAIAVARGQSVVLQPISRPAISSFDGKTNVEKAKNAEMFYANEAAKISKPANEWNVSI